MEVLCSSLRVKDLILNGEDEEKTFYKIIQAGSTKDMRTFDQHILELYATELITEESAMRFCSFRNEIARGLDNIKSSRGESTSNLSGLAMEEEEDSRW